MQKRGVTLAELAEMMVTFPQTQRTIKVKDKKDFSQIPQIQRMIKECQKELGERGRILIRYSGTEPVLRIMIEGENEEKIGRMADAMAEAVQKALG
jgi:phosphoglucosamine mutase